MKKLSCTLLVILFALGFASAQHFDQYFINKNLRVNYLHIGNFNNESLKIDH